MSVIRVARRPRFSAIDRRTIRDDRLSFRARGILCWLLDKPDDWSVRSDGIAGAGTEGRDAVRSALKELEELGYLRRQKVKNALGQFYTETWVYERPVGEVDNVELDLGEHETAGQPEDWKPGAGQPGDGSPVVGEPVVGNPGAPRNTDSVGDEKNNGEERRRKRRPPHDFEPTAEHESYAADHGLDLEAERVGWLTWCEANGRTYASVNAGFSTWLQRAVEFGRGGATRPRPFTVVPDPPRPTPGPWVCDSGNPHCDHGMVTDPDDPPGTPATRCGCMTARRSA